MEHRKLGRSGITVSALGFGTYGLSRLYRIRTKDGDIPASYGKVDDQESVRAIQRALEMGINFFDTADKYGCGHAESVLRECPRSPARRANTSRNGNRRKTVRRNRACVAVGKRLACHVSRVSGDRKVCDW